MHMLLLPSGAYLNLALAVTVEKLAAERVQVQFVGGVHQSFTGRDAAAILEALDATRLKIAYRKRS